jgi:hypothetical protein
MSNFCTSIDINGLDYQQLGTNKMGGKQVNVRTVKGSSNYYDRITFQMSEDQNTNLQKAVWSMKLLPNQDPNKRTLELTIESDTVKDFLRKLDQQNIEVATQRSKEWFKKDFDAATIRASYVPILKENDTNETIKVKVFQTEKNMTEIYRVTSQDGEELDTEPGCIDDITMNAKCMVVAATNGLWFMQKQFGMSIQATHILVWPQRVVKGINAFSFSNGSKINFNSKQNNDDPADMED